MTNTVSHEVVQLMAGPLVMTFDPASAMLRYVSMGKVELVRGVFAAVRDRDWNTLPLSVDELQINRSPDRFELSFVAKCSQSGIEFDWRGTVTGSAAGVVRFKFGGEAKSTFLRNRIGLCVLHPIKECVGRACTIEHQDSSTTNSVFPKWISPHQPFKDVRSMTHEVANGLCVKVTFEGEVFETEDQRNWTDASYKTYGTPLELPFPVEIEKGSHVNQSVTIELLGGPPSTPGARSVTGKSGTEVNVVVDWGDPRPMAQVGLSMATCGQRPTDALIQRLRRVRPSHLRVDVRLDRSDWEDDLRRAIDLASRLDTKLEVASFLDDIDSESWEQCLSEFTEIPHLIARWLVFHSTAKSTPDSLAKTAEASLKKLSPKFPVVVGTDAYFAELNRNRPSVPDGCSVSFSINPQVHVFDNLSVCETLEAQRWAVDSANELFGVPVIVSPITLRPRFNPNATSVGRLEKFAEPETDARQATGFVAAWTVGVLAQLASHRNVASLTFYETFGPRGIMTATGEAYPVAAVFEAIGGVSTVFQTTSTSPMEVAAIGIRRSSGAGELLLANLSKRPKTVCATNKRGRRFRFQLEGETIRVAQLESHP